MTLFTKFDEIAYLESNPDVSEAVKNGSLESGDQHYQIFGRKEGRALRSRRNTAHGRIIITGTGRAGTTLLVQLLTALDFDTGFSFEEAMSNVNSISNAGLEHMLSKESPLVVKSPWLADKLMSDLADGSYTINFAIVPVRDLTEAAESRRRVHNAAIADGHNPNNYPGGLWLTETPSEQEQKLSEQFYKAIYALAHHKIQPLFLKFPDFARNAQYTFEALTPLMTMYGVSRQEFANAFDKVVDLKKITASSPS